MSFNAIPQSIPGPSRLEKQVKFPLVQIGPYGNLYSNQRYIPYIHPIDARIANLIASRGMQQLPSRL